MSVILANYKFALIEYKQRPQLHPHPAHARRAAMDRLFNHYGERTYLRHQAAINAVFERAEREILG